MSITCHANIASVITMFQTKMMYLCMPPTGRVTSAPS